MKLKKYIVAVSAAVTLIGAPLALSCGFEESSGYASNPFNLYEGNRYDEEGDGHSYEETLDFWTDYTGGAVKRDDIRKFFDEATLDNLGPGEYAFYDYLTANNDRNAINYILDCLELQELADAYTADMWDYEPPEAESMLQFVKKLDKVSTSDTFKPRYEFLKIRAYGAIKDNEGVMKTWKKNEKKRIPEGLRNRMLGYVGGVLYREGRYPEALDYFSLTDDNNSIQWCVDKLAGSDNLTKLYNHDPNSAAIPFILGDYMNYLIASTSAGRGRPADDLEVYDMDYDAEGWSAYDVSAQSEDIMALCRRAISEGTSDNPKMWATALGVLQAIGGNARLGLETLRDAKSMAGNARSERVLENFTLWALMLNSGKGDDALDSEFADTFGKYYNTTVSESKKKMTDYSRKARKEAAEDFYSRTTPKFEFLTNFFAEEAPAHFYSVGSPQRAMAVVAMLDDLPILTYGNEFLKKLRDMIDKERPLADGVAFLDFAQSPAQTNDIDRLLQPYAKKYINLANDALGTRLMRDGKFEEALDYLSQVDPKWINTQAIAPYLTDSYISADYYAFDHTPKFDIYYFGSPLNHKAIFCGNLIDAIDEYNTLSGDEKARKALEIAGRCHFASPMGDGWALSEYSWSVSRPKNEFTTMENKWLDKAAELATTPSTKSLVAYALLTVPSQYTEYGDPMFAFGVKENYNTNTVQYYLDSPTNRQLNALNYLKSNWSEDDMAYHIRSCDVLKSYMAGRFISKPSYGW